MDAIIKHHYNTKVVSLEQMVTKAQAYQQQGLVVVLCHGTFDLMHPGHISHLQRAAEEGDILFVSITADAFVNKGPGRPVFNAQLRAQSLAALACVDGVAINHETTAVNVIRLIKPAVYVKGNDYQSEEDVTGNIRYEIGVVEENGGRVFYTNEPTQSSTRLLNEHFCAFDKTTMEYLLQLRSNYQDGEIIEMIRSVQKQRVLVIGDAIIDEYHYTIPMGQSGKSNIMAVKYQSEERFAGGSMAVANHVAGFVDEVVLVAGLGRKKSHEKFVRSNLLANVTSNFFYYRNSPTLVKRRYIDNEMNKQFEVYFANGGHSHNELDDKVCPWLNQHLSEFDIVISADFGNGFISDGMIAEMVKHAKFLAVNTQINSGNRGYHVINRYSRADFVSLNEAELRLAAHNLHDSLEDVVIKVAKSVYAKKIAITQGPKGALFLDVEHNAKTHVPALSTKVVDRIGAGDAFLALTSLCVGSNIPSPIAAFVGSVAAALDVQTVCNQHSINSVALYKYIKTLMK